MKILFHTNQIIKFLSIIAILLITFNSIMLVVYFYIDNPDRFDFIQIIDLDQEANLPTLFSSILLLISAFLFYLLSKKSQILKEGHRIYWQGLSFIFVFLAFDESAKIHESIGDWTEQFVQVSGYLYYPWVISYAILVVFLGFFYFRFFFNMDRQVFFSFVKAAVIFLSGAIGFELLGAKEASLHGADSMLYCYYYTIEESLEMFGVIYLIHLLLTLLDGQILEIDTKKL